MWGLAEQSSQRPHELGPSQVRFDALHMLARDLQRLCVVWPAATEERRPSGAEAHYVEVASHGQAPEEKLQGDGCLLNLRSLHGARTVEEEHELLRRGRCFWAGPEMLERGLLRIDDGVKNSLILVLFVGFQPTESRWHFRDLEQNHDLGVWHGWQRQCRLCLTSIKRNLQGCVGRGLDLEKRAGHGDLRTQREWSCPRSLSSFVQSYSLLHIDYPERISRPHQHGHTQPKTATSKVAQLPHELHLYDHLAARRNLSDAQPHHVAGCFLKESCCLALGPCFLVLITCSGFLHYTTHNQASIHLCPHSGDGGFWPHREGVGDLEALLNWIGEGLCVGCQNGMIQDLKIHAESGQRHQHWLIALAEPS
mmetsp:Transcript_108531/g.151634  ORF Transcript_108531/g.151634 Transcript_108531/m.151634 type:complete len:366 (+) Transcript_108531:544-1641(+)